VNFPPSPPPRPVIRAALFAGRMKWQQGKELLRSHFSCNAPLLREMSRILDDLQSISLRRELSRPEDRLRKDILDDFPGEEVRGDDLGVPCE
jgi:hypothetical protein